MAGLHTLTVLVQNRAGVLARVTGLIARRGFNIESLAVAPTEDPTRSKITLVVDADSTPLEQVTKQLFKLIDVLKISELHPDDAVQRELALIVLRVDASGRGQVIELLSLYGGHVVDVGHERLTASVTGLPSEIDDIAELLRPFGIVELQRTGRVALPKLPKVRLATSGSARKAG
jgi:acetolactate synthase-1/3 small subunit